ncbi:MAG: hypothetical protein KC502_18600 [Myxococcales bacterium]|nr:hypothetical protein [Myxococcales bacterium]
MTEPPRYQLRSGVRLARGKDGRWLVQDKALRRAIRLGDKDARVLRLLSQGRGLRFDQLVGKVGNAAEVRRRLGALARLFVLAGPRSRQRLALQQEAASGVKVGQERTDEAIIFPQGSNPPRHACVATGACCSASFLGPMSEPDRLRVSGLTLGKRSQVSLGSEALESVEFQGQELWGMRRIAGSCVALGDDGLCDVHAEHGYDVKPIPCRQFPLRFHRMPWGLHVSLLLACEGYDRARDAAEPWPSRTAEVRGFVAEGAHVPACALPFEWTAGVPASISDTQTLLGALQADEAADDACPRSWLAAIIDKFERTAIERGEDLQEGPELSGSLRLATARLPGQLRDSTPWFDLAGLTAHQAHLAQRSAMLIARDEPADAERLTRFALGIDALKANLQLQPRGDFGVSGPARRHLLDVVANDLPAQIAIGHLDAGLTNLAVRLRFIEALACALCQAEGKTQVTARHTTLALKVAYRSEPDITALAKSRTEPPS